MLDGIWSFKLGTPLAMATGIAQVRDGKFFGGNNNYYFWGRLKYTDGNVFATLTAKHHTGPLNSILGALEEYSLDLEGEIVEGEMQLTATNEAFAKAQVQVLATKVAELDEAIPPPLPPNKPA